MYRYDEFDAEFVRQRVAQFRDQVARRVSGELTEEEFKPLRLRNGVYLQLHAYMLRIAVPYGTLSARQMRKLAHIARTYDRGYGHFTTRQNLQFNWPRLTDIPDILDELAEVEMHAIQTSGNCIRNVTADHFAGAAADEVADPRPYAEIIRQWSSLHPEFSFLPRKFKVAVTAAEQRALAGLRRRGLVQTGGFTPSDAAHVLGLQANWPGPAALLAARLMARFRDMKLGDEARAAEFCREVWSETVRLSCRVVIETAFGENVAEPRLVDAVCSGRGTLGLAAVRVAPLVPVIAVGGPAGTRWRIDPLLRRAQLLSPASLEH